MKVKLFCLQLAQLTLENILRFAFDITTPLQHSDEGKAFLGLFSPRACLLFDSLMSELVFLSHVTKKKNLQSTMVTLNQNKTLGRFLPLIRGFI